MEKEMKKKKNTMMKNLVFEGNREYLNEKELNN